MLFELVFIIVCLIILLEDLSSKYITNYIFIIFLLCSANYYYQFYWLSLWFLIIFVYTIGILSGEAYEYFNKEIPFFWKWWKLFWSWVYDYFLYLFIPALLFSELFYFSDDLFNILIKDIFIFTLTAFCGYFLYAYHLRLLTKTIIENGFNKSEELYAHLENNRMNIFKYQIPEDGLSKEQETLFGQIKKRIPLFVFGNTFIIFFILFA